MGIVKSRGSICLGDVRQYIKLLVILAAEVAFFAVFAPYFATSRNFVNILRQASEIGLMAIPLTLLLVAGFMDLSVGSIMGLSGIVVGLLMRSGVSIPVAILAGLLIGVAVGLLNGFMIGCLNIQGVVVTIGTQVMVRGLCYIITQGRAVSGYPRAFFALNQRVAGLPISVWTWLTLSVLAIVILERSYIGRNIKGIGNNATACVYSGVPGRRYKVMLFAFCGLITALASIFLISRISSAEATLGSGYELDVITAALLGGVSIMGGKGTIQGAMLGILIIGILRNGLNMMGLSSIYQSIILGVLLLLAVVERKKNNHGCCRQGAGLHTKHISKGGTP